MWYHILDKEYFFMIFFEKGDRKNMKKALSLIMSAMMVVAIALSMSGCNSKITVQDYIESDAFKTEVSSVKEQLEGQGMSVDITAKENALVYSYTLNQELSEEDLEAYTQTLEASASTLQTTMKQVYDEVVKAVGSEEGVTVTMEYADAAGNQIASFTYPE